MGILHEPLESAEKKVQALTLHFFTRKSINLGLSDNDKKKDATAIIAAIKKYIDGHINKSVECKNFRRRTQQQGESFDNYLLSLRELVKTCNFCSNNFCSNDCTQKNLRDEPLTES